MALASGHQKGNIHISCPYSISWSRSDQMQHRLVVAQIADAIDEQSRDFSAICLAASPKPETKQPTSALQPSQRLAPQLRHLASQLRDTGELLIGIGQLLAIKLDAAASP